MKSPLILAVTTASDPVPLIDPSPLRGLVADVVTVESAAGSLANAEIVIAGKWTEEMSAAAPNMRWLNLWTAGIDGAAIPALARRGVLVTHSSGVHAVKIATHMMACVLMFACRMPHFMRAQRAGAWKTEGDGYDDLSERTIGIVGLGRIGEALAVRARSFGMRVVATKRDVAHRYDPTVAVDALYPANRLPEMLAEADHVCITTRYTPATHHLFDRAMLAHMKRSAYLHNTARGRIVDEAALVDALQARSIRGAALDVFETEPLAAASPLWAMENVIVTPHVAGYSPTYFPRVAQLFAENLARYTEGKALSNLYDPERGY